MSTKQEQTEERYKNLRNTVLISCNPPEDCNDPKVLKTYMKACYNIAKSPK